MVLATHPGEMHASPVAAARARATGEVFSSYQAPNLSMQSRRGRYAIAPTLACSIYGIRRVGRSARREGGSLRYAWCDSAVAGSGSSWSLAYGRRVTGGIRPKKRTALNSVEVSWRAAVSGSDRWG